MATSPAHRFGQIIGEVLEAAMTPLLEAFAQRYELYLDKHGARPCRPGKKCRWVDLNNNAHDLDFVLERGGTPEKKGLPAAFIETAWRRYTKHSRNKAQEIQGAIMPLVETYRNAAPFQGAILAGVFTNGALTQLRSLGFTVLYFQYDTVVAVFRRFGIDAAFGEDTPDQELQVQVDAYGALSAAERQDLARELWRANGDDVNEFIAALTIVVSRQIERIVILPLRGSPCELININDAVEFVETYDERPAREPFQRYEIQIKYNNGNLIDGSFMDKMSAIEFLRIYQPVALD